ncbi:MAG: LCP family protein [Anaerolineales bacterium]|jgi:LCP family protein required for cell wall assembly|nr:LCP family protein [Anaerolineales bacterium]
MKSAWLSFLLLPALLLGACAPGRATATAALGTPTPTPFLPAGPAGELPTPWVDKGGEAEPHLEDVGFGDFPGPTEASDIEIPPQMGKLPQPEGQINILILGSDQRPSDGGFRTDVIELLTINSADKTVTLTSFPRDLYVYHPGWRITRINAGMQRGGFEMMANTFAYNFGVKPDYYILINFSGFERMIDTLGGVDVQVGRALWDEREGPGDYSVPSGRVHMDGETALWYVRSRGTTSDYDRGRRHQEMIAAIFERLVSLNALTRIPELHTQYKDMVQTNIGLAQILGWVPVASAVRDTQAIQRYSVGPDDVTPFRNSVGSAVLIPNAERVRRILLQALSSPESSAAGAP